MKRRSFLCLPFAGLLAKIFPSRHPAAETPVRYAERMQRQSCVAYGRQISKDMIWFQFDKPIDINKGELITATFKPPSEDEYGRHYVELTFSDRY